MKIKLYPSLRNTALGLAAAMSMAGAAAAATVNEADMPGGEFSSVFGAPTAIAAGVTTITGTGNADQYDYLYFSGLEAGPQPITITLQAPVGILDTYAAGGQVLVKDTPLAHGWDGASVGIMNVTFNTPLQLLEILLDGTTTGDLYLAMLFTNGENLQYSINIPGNIGTGPVDTAAVPLPAGFLLLGPVLAGLGVASSRRRKAA